MREALLNALQQAADEVFESDCNKEGYALAVLVTAFVEGEKGRQECIS